MDEPHNQSNGSHSEEPGSQPQPESPSSGPGVATGGRALLVYATRHGSTSEVADAVAEELRTAFAEVDVREATAAPPPGGYDAVVVGAPMIMGWHKDAEKYLKRHRALLASVPFAVFVTAASLTEDGLDAVKGVPVVKDTWLVKKPKNADKLGRKERYALPSHYVGDILDACKPARPRSVALFAGSLDLTKMNLLEKLFVLFIVGATPGDGRHFEFVREWASGVAAELSS